jgi:hypothetical protein
MSDVSNCRTCNQQIWWWKSKAGKNYCTSSPDKRDFHKCSGREATPPTAQTAPARTPQTKANSPVSGPYLEQRVTFLEVEVRKLQETVALLQGRKDAAGSAITKQNPVSDEDIPF